MQVIAEDQYPIKTAEFSWDAKLNTSLVTGLNPILLTITNITRLSEDSIIHLEVFHSTDIKSQDFKWTRVYKNIYDSKYVSMVDLTLIPLPISLSQSQTQPLDYRIKINLEIDGFLQSKILKYQANLNSTSLLYMRDIYLNKKIKKTEYLPALNFLIKNVKNFFLIKILDNWKRNKN